MAFISLIIVLLLINFFFSYIKRHLVLHINLLIIGAKFRTFVLKDFIKMSSVIYLAFESDLFLK
jgi:hypothetical protein